MQTENVRSLFDDAETQAIAERFELGRITDHGEGWFVVATDGS
jgi:hypothetical protein